MHYQNYSSRNNAMFISFYENSQINTNLLHHSYIILIKKEKEKKNSDISNYRLSSSEIFAVNQEEARSLRETFFRNVIRDGKNLPDKYLRSLSSPFHLLFIHPPRDIATLFPSDPISLFEIFFDKHLAKKQQQQQKSIIIVFFFTLSVYERAFSIFLLHEQEFSLSELAY